MCMNAQYDLKVFALSICYWVIQEYNLSEKEKKKLNHFGDNRQKQIL